MASTRLTLVAEHPTSMSADCTRGKLRLRLKLTHTLATTAFPWPTTPATQAGLEFELLASPPPAGAAAAREALSFPSLVKEALSRMVSPSLQPTTTMAPCLSPSSTTWCRQPRGR